MRAHITFYFSDTCFKIHLYVASVYQGACVLGFGAGPMGRSREKRQSCVHCSAPQAAARGYSSPARSVRARSPAAP